MPVNKNKKTGFSRLKRHLQKRMLSGLLLMLPLGISLLILRFLYNITAGLLVPFLEKFFGHFPPFFITLLSMLILLLGIYFMGFFGAFVIGKRIIKITENILLKIPLLKTIYLSAKSIVTTFSSSRQASFKSTVLVEFPKAGAFSIGFITGEISGAQDKKYYKVFIPTSPNPTSGFLQILPVEMVTKTDISIENAFKMIISGGVIGPDNLSL